MKLNTDLLLVCVCVCLSARERISENSVQTSPNFRYSVACGRGRSFTAGVAICYVLLLCGGHHVAQNGRAQAMRRRAHVAAREAKSYVYDCLINKACVRR